MTASRGRNGLMEWLVHHSSDAFINARDRESGYTPLHRSIFYGQIHSAVALMKLGKKYFFNWSGFNQLFTQKVLHYNVFYKIKIYVYVLVIIAR